MHQKIMHPQYVKDTKVITHTHLASLAQLVERVADNHKVIGSNPVGSASINKCINSNAQLLLILKIA